MCNNSSCLSRAREHEDALMMFKKGKIRKCLTWATWSQKFLKFAGFVDCNVSDSVRWIWCTLSSSSRSFGCSWAMWRGSTHGPDLVPMSSRCGAVCPHKYQDTRRHLYVVSCCFQRNTMNPSYLYFINFHRTCSGKHMSIWSCYMNICCTIDICFLKIHVMKWY